MGIKIILHGLLLDIDIEPTEYFCWLLSSSQGNSTDQPYIIKTYTNGPEWYRLYSDGWCEQGGYYEGTRDAEEITITLLMPYQDVFYWVDYNHGVKNKNPWKEYLSALFVTIIHRTTTTFGIYSNGPEWLASGFGDGLWNAKGYVTHETIANFK